MPCGTPMNIEHSSHEFTLFTHKKGKEISHDDEKNCPLKMLLNSEKKNSIIKMLLGYVFIKIRVMF